MTRLDGAVDLLSGVFQDGETPRFSICSWETGDDLGPFGVCRGCCSYLQQEPFDLRAVMQTEDILGLQTQRGKSATAAGESEAKKARRPKGGAAGRAREIGSGEDERVISRGLWALALDFAMTSSPAGPEM